MARNTFVVVAFAAFLALWVVACHADLPSGPTLEAASLPKHSLMSDDAAADDNDSTAVPLDDITNSTSSRSCSRTKWEGFTSGLLCQDGVNGRCVYRVPISRALSQGANTFYVAFANGHSAPVYSPGRSLPEPIPQRHTATLSAARPTHVQASDAHLGAFAKATRPFFRLFGLVRRALRVLSRSSSQEPSTEQQLKVLQNDADALARFRPVAEKQTTAVAVRVGTYFEDDEEAEGGRRQHSMRLLLDEGFIEVEDMVEGWRTPGAVKPDMCRCDHCACILGLTIRAMRCN